MLRSCRFGAFSLATEANRWRQLDGATWWLAASCTTDSRFTGTRDRSRLSFGRNVHSAHAAVRGKMRFPASGKKTECSWQLAVCAFGRTHRVHLRSLTAGDLGGTELLAQRLAPQWKWTALRPEYGLFGNFAKSDTLRDCNFAAAASILSVPKEIHVLDTRKAGGWRLAFGTMSVRTIFPLQRG